MTFRSDHDAALARADALEKELAAERAERRRLEALLAERTQESPTTRKPPPAAKGVTGDQLGVIVLVITAIAILAAGLSSSP